ncbi:hypothetical protein BDP27DRAFT_1338390 [Rhodocollybia butyracea]|uniref:Glycan binding protein Y3-like domain-containing protein n=1 Tax=Rhodocollybia butyracea TaxID=206335 RepID=A0A9P5PDC1_9AGAR|nr:hypothetical protein BDP27DRAFT_1338390 [Rhodocollybia butyracea]
MLFQASHCDFHSKFGFVAFITLASISSPVLGQIFSCFESREVGDCSQFIDSFCQSANDIPVLNEQDNFSRCFNAPGGGFKCDLTAWNEFGTVSQNPLTAHCENVLNAIADNCPRGGQGMNVDTSPFELRMIPNSGSCSFNGN